MNTIRKLIYPSGKYNKKYINYLKWTFISNVIVSSESVIATHSMLSVISSDYADSTRTLNYVGKDIIGQIGSLGYMAKMSYKSDSEPRKFLLYSNLIQQSSYLLTTITPICPLYFIFIAGGANIASNISFTGFGAINAKCIQRLSEDDNIGEIYSKLTIVNTIGSSMGMILGIGITSLMPEYEYRIMLIPVLGILRSYTINKAINGLI